MSIQLRGGYVTEDRRLDRLPSVVTEHRERYPLTAATLPETPVPVVAGVNWYQDMDHPQRLRIQGRDRWVIGRSGWDLGRLRGGHAVCLRPSNATDLPAWWRYYHQGVEGRCVEFAMLRALSLLNRRRYDITSRWHYWQAQYADEWPGGSYPGGVPVYEGTSVRAGLDVLRRYGAIPARTEGRPVHVDFCPGGTPPSVRLPEGIAAYRWATTWDQVRAALGVPDAQPGVPLLNSWGDDYPRETLLMDEAGDRLLREDGEFGVVTDR